MTRPVSVQSKMTLKANSDLLNKMELLRSIELDMNKHLDPNQFKNGVKLSDQLKTLDDQVKAT